MKKHLSLFSFLVAGLVLAQEPKADSLLEAFRQKSNAVGVVAGFKSASKQWSNATGFSDKEEQQRMQSTTLIRIASVSKVMTATAIMQLVEEGKVQLDDAITSYLDDVPAHASKITVRHLLNHSSGIRAYKGSRERENKNEYGNLNEAFRIFKDDELVMSPGSGFYYTTYGYVVLGMIIESVSEVSYETFMKQRIWEPLGMSSTGIERSGESYSNKSTLYHKSGKGKVKWAEPTNLSDRVPGGGVYSTVEDILRFGHGLLDGQLIANSSLLEMVKDSGLKKEGNPYGLGLYLYGQNATYGNVVGHSGTQIGASVQLMLLPEKSAVTFAASNTSGTWEDMFYLAASLLGSATN